MEKVLNYISVTGMHHTETIAMMRYREDAEQLICLYPPRAAS